MELMQQECKAADVLILNEDRMTTGFYSFSSFYYLLNEFKHIHALKDKIMYMLNAH